MEIKVNQTQAAVQTEQQRQAAQADGTFKFTLASRVEEEGLQARLNLMMEEITRQGDRISRKMDIRDMELSVTW